VFRERFGDPTPYDPFATDIYYLGNLIRLYFLDGDEFVPKINGFEFMRPLVNDMVADNPEERPNIDECVARLDDITSSLLTGTLRSQVVYGHDWMVGYIWRLFPYVLRLISFLWLETPAVPLRKPT